MYKLVNKTIAIPSHKDPLNMAVKCLKRRPFRSV